MARKSNDDDVLNSETIETHDDQEPLTNFQKQPSEDEAPKARAPRKKKADAAADAEAIDTDEVEEIEERSDGRVYFENMRPKVKKYLKKLGDETKQFRDEMMAANKKYRDSRDALIDAMLKENLHEYELDTGDTVRVTEKYGLKISASAPDDGVDIVD